MNGRLNKKESLSIHNNHKTAANMTKMNIREEVLNCLYDNILEGRFEETGRLLEISSVNPNELIQDKGISLLHLAAGVEPEEYAEHVVELLLKYGGNPNTCSEDGMTALHVGAAWGRVNVVKMLLLAGADPSVIDMEGKSPVDYAREQGNQHVLLCLSRDTKEYLTCDSPCKYSLKLDKILVTNGTVEGEYYPEDIVNVEPFRKSDYINEWFAKSPKLESTILKQSDDCDSNKTPTNSVKKLSGGSTQTANNFSSESSKTETPKNSTLYESCVSSDCDKEKKNSNLYNNSLFTSDTSYERNDQIKNKTNTSLLSGITPLEITRNNLNTRKSKGNKELVNIIRNVQFKVPNISDLKPHQNYNTRTNIKSGVCKILEYYNNEEQGVECSTLMTSHWSDQTCDMEADCSSSECTQSSDYLNRALMASSVSLGSAKSINSTSKTNNSQKSTSLSKLNNGFVNTNRGKYTNTLSDVSKNGSLMNDTLPSVAEEYKYQDDEAGVALIEKRVLVNAPLTINPNASGNQSGVLSSISSLASSLPMSLNYDTDTLRKELKLLGVTPGPITKTTKRVYLKRLNNIKNNPIVLSVGKTDHKTYSIELEKTFRDSKWNADLTNYMALEKKLSEEFEAPNPNKKWREGIIKSSFTYLLLDPRISDNLPCKSDTMQSTDVWRNFVDSIFYIGKGKRSRPYSHLYDAVTLYNSGRSITDNDKVQTILNIWKDKCGVVCLHIFQNVIPVEAYTREAAMIEVMGLKNLKNIKPGNYYGSVATWSFKQKKLLGVYLLHKAMLIFLSEGERQLRPVDIK